MRRIFYKVTHYFISPVNNLIFNTKTTYKIVQYFVSFWLSHRRKYSTVAMATTAFFSLTKPKITQNFLDYFINQFGITLALSFSNSDFSFCLGHTLLDISISAVKFSGSNSILTISLSEGIILLTLLSLKRHNFAG